MEGLKPVLTITSEEWHEKSVRGLAAVVHDRPYIVMTHETSREPVYQPVAIGEPSARR